MLLTNYSIKFRVTVFALISILVIAGPAVYLTMPREGAPDITIPYVFVTAPYEGVAPAEIENLITIPLEKRFNDLENVKEVTSTSAEGVSSVVIEFTPKEDIDTALQRVKDKIDLARPDLPRDLDQPIVQGLNFSTDIPVLTLAISGDADRERLKKLAEDLRDLIESVPSVLQARVYGTREREIRVEVDAERLTAYTLTMFDVIQAIRRENSTVSAGNLEITGNKFQVRVPGEFTDVRRMNDIIVKAEEGCPIHLTDVATVRDTYKDLTSISRINGEPCVSIGVHKRAGENAVRLIRKVKEVIAGGRLPPGIQATAVFDQSEIIRMMIEDLENNVVTGFLLVLVVLLLFMGVRNSILVALAIPFSMMIGFIVLASLGMTLNFIVLFSLVLAVGMLVDNAIVIVENIYRHHSEGASKVRAALSGAAEVAWPVTASTLTTLAAFLPMVYWPGIMGQFMGFLPKTVIVILSASLFVALVINPAICSVFISRDSRRESARRPVRWNRFMDGYEDFLRGALAHRGLCMAIGFAFLVFSILLFARFGRGVELFPETEPRRATIDIRYPEGTDIETTDATLAAIEGTLKPYSDIKFYQTNVGSGGQWLLSGSSGAGTHVGSIQIEFLPSAERSRSSAELVKRIRAGVGTFPGALIKVEQEKEGPPTGAAVSIEVSGEDFEVLGDLSDRIIRRIKDVPGLVDVQDNLEDARPELQFRVDRQRAAMLKLDTDAVGQFLRTAVNGEAVSKFRAGEDEYDITVRLREDQRSSINLLKQVAITAPEDQSVPLASLGDFVYEGGQGQIIRKNQKRVITVSGNKQGRGVDKILKDVRERVAGMALPKGYTVSYAGDTREMNEAMAFLSKAFLVALALIALILVMEFNSVVLPFIILMSVVLSMIGVMWGLITTGTSFGVVMTGIGVISLAGVVVNNGIVLIACIEQRHAQGLGVTDAIVTGGRLRLRPVLLTAMSTVIALVPMAIGWSLDIHSWPPRIAAATETSSWWRPMAVAVIYGLMLATLLTLVQVPVMVSLAESLRALARKRLGSGSNKTREPSPSIKS